MVSASTVVKTLSAGERPARVAGMDELQDAHSELADELRNKIKKCPTCGKVRKLASLQPVSFLSTTVSATSKYEHTAPKYVRNTTPAWKTTQENRMTQEIISENR